MGVFVALEGGDGSGKGTQALELELRATKAGYDVLRVSFPNYGTQSAKFVEKYLTGQYGPANSIHPELASMLYAVDRYVSGEKIRQHLSKPRALVIADRYTASNLAHQGTKLQDTQERHAFYETILHLEFGIFNLPQPDINFLLLVPSSIAQKNIDRKPSRSYTKDKRDEHEKDAGHLQHANENYRELAELYPKLYVPINCLEADSGTMRPITAISEDIWQAVFPLLQVRAS